MSGGQDDELVRVGVAGRHAAPPLTVLASLDAVLDALPAPTVLLDPDGRVAQANAAWTESFASAGRWHEYGVGADYVDIARRFRDDIGADVLLAELGRLCTEGGAPMSVDVALGPDHGERWVHIQASRVEASGQLVVTHTDISARVHAVRSSAWQARHDHLTELPNRSHLHELIDRELDLAWSRPLALLFLDVDGFKEVNDSLGHDVGDDLLRAVAERLSVHTREEDVVGRLGGDEFVVVCRNCDADAAEALARRCQQAFRRRFAVGGTEVALTVSIGIASTAGVLEPATRASDLVGEADLAMAEAKGSGRNVVRTFRPELRRAAQQRLQVVTELRTAIDAGQLVVHYQPVMHLGTRSVTGVEALVRWQHPQRGLLGPGDFISIAEQAGMVDDLTRWMLHAVARAAAAWDELGLALTVAVNISATHFATGTLVADVEEALSSSGLARERLVLELTETSVAEDPDRAAAQFAELRVSGIEVSIDDFGSGFSSLGQIVSMPAGILKIDRSLVSGMGGDRRPSESAAAVEAVVGLARACGMRSVAEGVETAEQLEMVAALGCTYGQGFFIARPMPAEDLSRWLRKRSRRRASAASAAVAAAVR